MSNIVQSSRRRSTMSFIPPPKPKISVDSDEDDTENSDDGTDDENSDEDNSDGDVDDNDVEEHDDSQNDEPHEGMSTIHYLFCDAEVLTYSILQFNKCKVNSQHDR